MKKITILLLSVVFVFMMTCSSYTMVDINVSAVTATHTLPSGTTMTAGSIGSATGTKITTAAQFQAMVPGGTYYLAAHITLDSTYKTITGYTNSNNPGDLSSDAIKLDGRGYTVTNNSGKPIFRTLSTGSRVENLVLEGSTVKVTSNLSGYAAGSLAARSYGGVFRNIVNKVPVNLDTDVTTQSNNYVRCGGIIGMALVADILFEDCVNTAAVSAGEASAGASDTIGGVGGILGYQHTSDVVVFLNCRNAGNITNRLTSYYHAGGIVGAKATSSSYSMYLINCTNKSGMTLKRGSSSVTSDTTERQYLFGGNSTNAYDNKAGVVKLTSAADFAKVSGTTNYYLASSFSGVTQNNNDFSGTIYGCFRTMTCTEPPLANMTKFKSAAKLTITVTGWTKISNATEFGTMKNGNKYYLGASFTLPTTYTRPSGLGYDDTSANFTLDGCGWTITTSKPIFWGLPSGGAGANGSHSMIRNLVVAGNVSVTRAELESFNNGWSVGALVGKANGGIFRNITNNANVTYEGYTNASDEGVRIGGICGSAFNDSVTFENCVNNGTVKGIAYGKDINGVAGILGYAGYPDATCTATFTNCTNKGTITNTATSTEHAYAGGILGVKQYHVATKVNMTNCYNTGAVKANTGFGKYYAIHTYQNVNMVRT